MNIGLVLGVILGELSLYAALKSQGMNDLLILAIIVVSAFIVIFTGSKLLDKQDEQDVAMDAKREEQE